MSPHVQQPPETFLMIESNSENRTYWQNVFNKYDRDNDGQISGEELRAMINGNVIKEVEKKSAMNKFMSIADKDNSGTLSFQEFFDMLQHENIHHKAEPDLKAMLFRYMNAYVDFVVPLGKSEPTLPTVTPNGRDTVYLDSIHLEAYSSGESERRTEGCRCWPPVLGMFLLSCLEVFTFIYDAVHGSVEADGPIAEALVYYPDRRQEVWRFLTYMLVHNGGFHLLINVVVQLSFGIPLEARQGWWRVGVVYMAGVAACSLADSVVDPTHRLAGASGGVFAIITAHVATIILNWSEMRCVVLRLICFMLLGALIVGNAYYVHFVANKSTTAHAGHLAAAFAGLLVGVCVLRNIKVKEWEKRLWWVAVVLFSCLMLVGILMNIFWTQRFPPSA